MTDNLTPSPEQQTREEKLKVLRESVRTGRYEIDTDKLAKVMIQKASQSEGGLTNNEGPKGPSSAAESPSKPSSVPD